MADIMGSFNSARYDFHSLQYNKQKDFESERPIKLDCKAKYLFFILFMMQLLNSMDRGYTSGDMDTMTVAFNYTGPEAGSLNSVFYAGMMVAIVPTTYLSNIIEYPFFLISSGFSLWTMAIFLSSMTQNYIQLIICRFFVGVGDALFVVIAVPFIDYNAPVDIRGSLMALFLSLYPIGISLGTVMAGIIIGWKVGFTIEGSLMIPFILCGFLIKFRQKLSKRHTIKYDTVDTSMETDIDTTFSISPQNSSKRSSFTSIISDVITVMKNPLIWLGSFGYAGLMGVTAGLGIWNITYARIILDRKKNIAAPAIAIMIGFASMFGTLIGGTLLDYFGRRQGGKSCYLAFTICGIFSFISIPFLSSAYLVRNFISFLILSFVGITFLMIAGANLVLATLWSASIEHRVIASGMITTIQHICGTVPIPIIIGIFKGNDQNKFPPSIMPLLGCWMIWPAGLSYISAIVAKTKGVGTNVDVE